METASIAVSSRIRPITALPRCPEPRNQKLPREMRLKARPLLRKIILHSVIALLYVGGLSAGFYFLKLYVDKRLTFTRTPPRHIGENIGKDSREVRLSHHIKKMR